MTLQKGQGLMNLRDLKNGTGARRRGGWALFCELAEEAARMNRLCEGSALARVCHVRMCAKQHTSVQRLSRRM
jgi:hypothetical protein